MPGPSSWWGRGSVRPALVLGDAGPLLALAGLVPQPVELGGGRVVHGHADQLAQGRQVLVRELRQEVAQVQLVRAGDLLLGGRGPVVRSCP